MDDGRNDRGKRDRLESAWTRRSCLTLGVAAGGAGLLAAVIAPGQASAQARPNIVKRRRLDPAGGLSVVLIGTGTPVPSPDRACACTAVVAGDRVLVVDTGRGSLTRFAQAGFADAEATLFTHYHSDHFSDFGEFMVTRTIAGADRPMKVIGPAGAKEAIGSLLAAYRLDDGYRKAHHGDKWNEDGMKARIVEAEPGVVFEDGDLIVTMFEVDHAPIKPAMGYRFEYRGQVAVVSGDTRPVPRMVEMAAGADVLVHEAMNRRLIELARRQADDRMQAMMTEMMEYHSEVLEVAEIAAQARVKKLVLTHLVPGLPPNPAADRLFTQGMRRIYRGWLRVGRDGMEIKA